LRESLDFIILNVLILYLTYKCKLGNKNSNFKIPKNQAMRFEDQPELMDGNIGGKHKDESAKESTMKEISKKSSGSSKEEIKSDKYGNSSTGNSDSDGSRGVSKKSSQGYASHGSSKGSTKDRDHSHSDSVNSKDSSDPNVS
jgi:hypothetical protein